MKEPHNKNEYHKLPEQAEKTNTRQTGAYWYVDVDADKLAERAFIRTFFTALAFVLELAILLLPATAGSIFVSKYVAAYGLIYVVTVITMLIVSIWLFIMNAVKYKFTKRIPAELAPKRGFKRRAFLGNEIYMGITAALAVFELSFVCIKYDWLGLIYLFLSLAATACAILAREFTRRTLISAVLIPASEGPADDGQDEQSSEPEKQMQDTEPDRQNGGSDD